jgi:hypothetical protein
LPAVTAHIHYAWFGLMVVVGLAFGLIGDRRPFGSDMLAHPLAVFFSVAAAGLLILRVALAKPVPELIPERTLLIGCLLGGAAFLTGNWISTYLIAVH